MKTILLTAALTFSMVLTAGDAFAAPRHHHRLGGPSHVRCDRGGPVGYFSAGPRGARRAYRAALRAERRAHRRWHRHFDRRHRYRPHRPHRRFR